MLIRRQRLLIATIAVAVFLVLGRAWGALIGDHAWFDAVGFADVWWWRTTVSLLLKVGVGVVATCAMRLHLEAVRRSFVSVVVPGSVGNIEVSGAVPDRTISLVSWACALLVGIVLTIPIDDWRPLAAVLDARPFGEADPYYQYDLSFWTAWLPFEQQLYAWALISHAVMSMLTIFGYVVTRGIGTDGRAVRITRHARRHISVLGALLLALIAWTYRLDGFERLLVGSGPDGAFGFADHRVGLPGSVVMQIIASGAAGVVIWSAWSRQPRASIAAVTTVLAMALLLRQGLPLFADGLSGSTDPVARERLYLEAGASFTRRAYESDRVIGATVGDTASSTTAPIWDRGTLPHPSAATLSGLLAWDGSNGLPRAIQFESLRTPGLLPTWRATTLDLSKANLARESSAGASQTLPPIAVSDSGRGYAIVSDPAHHIAGPSIATTSARLALAWNQQNPRLLFGTLPSPSPVLVTVRDVRERLALLAPFLQAGAAVTPLIHADSLLWSVDLYAVSGTYPLTDHLLLNGEAFAAAQFAATALVNAHTGRVTLVPTTDQPLLALRPLERLAAHLTPLQSLPVTLRDALPPRGDALALEGAIAARLGSRAVDGDTTALVRQGGTLAALSLEYGIAADSIVTVDDYVPVWLPAQRHFALTAAALDTRGVIRGVMLAPGGSDRRVRWHPTTDGATYERVLGAIQETTDSLRQPGTLGGARRGGTRVLPTAGSPRFFTPYFALRDGRATLLTAVLVTDGRRRGVASDTPEALLDLRGSTRGAIPTSAAAVMYRQMREALQRGAWSEFGASFEALGRALGVPRDSVPQ